MSYSDTRYTGPTSPSTLPDLSSAHTHALTHHEGGNSDLFSNALSFIQERASSLSEGDIDEQHAVKAHQALYGGGGDEEHHDSRSVGAASALQALKMFMSEGGGGGGAGSGGGFDQNALIGMAMAQAGKVWDEKESQGISMVSIPSSSFFLHPCS